MTKLGTGGTTRTVLHSPWPRSPWSWRPPGAAVRRAPKRPAARPRLRRPVRPQARPSGAGRTEARRPRLRPRRRPGPRLRPRGRQRDDLGLRPGSDDGGLRPGGRADSDRQGIDDRVRQPDDRLHEADEARSHPGQPTGDDALPVGRRSRQSVRLHGCVRAVLATAPHAGRTAGGGCREGCRPRNDEACRRDDAGDL